MCVQITDKYLQMDHVACTGAKSVGLELERRKMLRNAYSQISKAKSNHKENPEKLFQKSNSKFSVPSNTAGAQFPL